MLPSREELQRIFITSKEKGTAIGLRIKGRQNLLITTIREITDSTAGETIVVTNDHTIYGEYLPVTEVKLSEIQWLVNLRIHFNDPFYQYIRTLRSNMKDLQKETGVQKAG